VPCRSFGGPGWGCVHRAWRTHPQRHLVDPLKAQALRSKAPVQALNYSIVQSTLHDMQTGPPPLLPILRSQLQAEILTLLLLTPEREWTLTDVSRRTGASVATVQREVVRAEQAGVLRSRRLGNVRLVQAAESPLTAPLTELLLRSFGPRKVIGEELGGLPGIDQMYLYGSWAARYRGEEGRAPMDVDVLIIGAPDRTDLDEAAQRAAARIAREVNVTIRSKTWWDDATDSFHSEVKSRPLIQIVEPTSAAQRPSGEARE
jgi:predicted nucleotidyltransferase